jgi:ADP-ribose pyrophosphatase YjhB (NUDIX family)
MPRKSTPSIPGAEKVVPELKRRLQATPADSPMRAYFTLTTPPGEKFRDAESTHETVSRILHEATKASKATPEDLKIFGSTQSFSISAPSEFVRELTRSDQIAKAFPSRDAKEMIIPPVGPTKIVELPDLTAKGTAKGTAKTAARKVAKKTPTTAAKRTAKPAARTTAKSAKVAGAKKSARKR